LRAGQTLRLLGRSWALSIIVAIGYFYTVRPAFQLQLLQEQTAALQITNDKAKQELEQTKVEQGEASEKLAELNAQLTEVAKSRDVLAAELNKETAREAEALNAAAGAQLRLTSQAELLVAAQRRLFYTRFQTALLGYWLGHSQPYPDGDEPHGDFIAKAKDAWPNPYNILSQVLNSLEAADSRSHEFPTAWVTPLRQVLDENKSATACDPVDFEGTRKAYVQEMSEVDGLSLQEAITELDRQKEEARSRHQVLIANDDDVLRFKRSYRIGHIYGLHRKYVDLLSVAINSCLDKGAAPTKMMEQKILAGT
jgi:hypothetical protein